MIENAAVSIFLKGLMIGVIVSAPLGPIGMLCLQRTINRGRAYGFATGLGATCSDLFYALIAAFSMSIVFDFIEAHAMLLKVIGSIVFFIFGLHTYRDNPVKQLKQMNENDRPSLLKDFFTSFGLTITNPLAMFLFMGLFAKFSFINGDMGKVNISFRILSILCGALIWWCLIVNLVNIFRSRFNLRSLAILNKVTGIVLMVFSPLALIYSFIAQ